VEGEIFGCLGRNGAGKTNTISSVWSLLSPNEGRAWVNGHDVVREPDAVRRSIGLVFQDPSLDEQLTARENLEFHAILYDIPPDVRRRRMEEVLRMVELYDRKDDLVRTFSGGMKRRLEIARGLMHYPKVLFLDEPTLGLDPQTRRRIWDYIRELKQRENITIFLTTHYMDEAENADRIAIIDYGRIVALDTPDNLKRMVGGDVITIKTPNDEVAAAFITQRFGVEVKRFGLNGGIYFEVDCGEEFIPRLVREAPFPISSISLRRPTLDDVFLKLTGRQIRDGEISSLERMRERFRLRRRR
ncbi:MAG: ABC transporter ATP-binding protein, partial [Chloroflexi bacterium]